MENILITKFAFNNLSVEEQINYFNLKLGNGFKISEICKELGIAYNTIRDRFTRNNYIFNKISKQYECAERIFPLDEEIIERALEKIVTKVFNQDKTITSSPELICNLDGQVINRSFRIYEDVLKDFTQFCNDSNYSQYDILSKFISEGIQKYRKI